MHDCSYIHDTPDIEFYKLTSDFCFTLQYRLESPDESQILLITKSRSKHLQKFIHREENKEKSVCKNVTSSMCLCVNISTLYTIGLQFTSLNAWLKCFGIALFYFDQEYFQR